MVSLAHEELVAMILSWIDKKDLGADAQIFCDQVGILGDTKPQKIGGYFPDVYCFIPSTNHIIIGDGKTPADLETRHTKDQLDAFANFLASSEGTGELVVATRFEWAGCARSILRSLEPVRERGEPDVRVLCEFGEWG